jgi:hypothetical protein
MRRLVGDWEALPCQIHGLESHGGVRQWGNCAYELIDPQFYRLILWSSRWMHAKKGGVTQESGYC